MTPPVLAEVTRGGVVESVHRGSLVVPGSLSLGDVDGPMFPRSAVKPLQALGMLRSGLRLDGTLLALACASHGGEPFHLDGVRAILSGAGIDESDLRNTPGVPMADAAREAYGARKTRLAANCSGKHAAMLATCVRNDWPTENYLDPTHPLQRTIIRTIEDACGERVHSVAVDGCGAPAVVLSLGGLARGFADLFSGTDDDQRRIVAAMTAHPEYVGDAERVDTRLMRALPGTVAKIGAEGVLAAALPDRRSLALKIADGNRRACPAVLVAALRAIGLGSPAIDAIAADAPEVRATSTIAEHAGDALP